MIRIRQSTDAPIRPRVRTPPKDERKGEGFLYLYIPERVSLYIDHTILPILYRGHIRRAYEKFIIIIEKTVSDS